MIKDYLNRKFKYYALNLELGNLLEIFWVSAIASLLLVRIYLGLTGYPKLGGGNFHIAHMLWGGFMMMGAIFLLLAFLNKQAKQLAAVVGGIGFGMFIDELGKFITNDNNYFYQPAVALIYVIFVLLFFLMRILEKRIKLSKTEYALNAIEEIKELVIDDLDEAERQKILKLLEQGDQQNIVVQNLKNMLSAIKGKEGQPSGVFSVLRKFFSYVYRQIILTEAFSKFLVTFFAVFALVGLVGSLLDFQNGTSAADMGEFLFALTSAILISRGTIYLHDNVRLKAYYSFKNAVLVSLFLTQFFSFVKDQFSALLGLIVSIAAFIACEYLIAQEEAAAKSKTARVSS